MDRTQQITLISTFRFIFFECEGSKESITTIYFHKKDCQGVDLVAKTVYCLVSCLDTIKLMDLEQYLDIRHSQYLQPNLTFYASIFALHFPSATI